MLKITFVGKMIQGNDRHNMQQKPRVEHDSVQTQIGWLHWTQMSILCQWEISKAGKKFWTKLMRMSNVKC